MNQELIVSEYKTQLFNNGNFNVRVIIIDNEPWFVAKDVADILGYSVTEKMLRRLDEDEKADIPFRDFRSTANNVHHQRIRPIQKSNAPIWGL